MGWQESINRARVNNYSDDHGDDEYDSGSDDDSSDDGGDGGGRGEKDSGDDESGDDDGDDVGCGKKDSGGDESGDDDDDDDDDNDGMNNEGREDGEEEGDDEFGGGRRLNGLGRMLEEEAVAAGMRESITNKSNNKQKGGRGLRQSEETGECPKRNRRVPARNND